MKRKTPRRTGDELAMATGEKHKGRQAVANSSRAVGRPCDDGESKGEIA